MAEFHFLRPLWLVLLPVGAWLIWQLLRGRADGGGWRSVVDARLRAYVLAEPEVLRDSRLALGATLVACSVAIVALAGPAWERLPVPAFRSDEALVVALDLSRSMDAADVEPSRLARAKLKLLDLLERRAAGQTALVVFSTHAFTVTPLTTDTRTIAALVNAVDPDIMPTQGGSLSAGLERAATLLRQTGLRRGDILLITDSEVNEADLDLTGELASDGFRVSVLAVGTEQGAPIPLAEGGFVNDAGGQVVVPQLDAASLRRLASAGSGRFAQLASSDRDLETLFPSSAPLPLDAALDGASEEQYEADVWLDRGLWLAVALLPLLALSFRRGWISLWLLVVLAPCGGVRVAGSLEASRPARLRRATSRESCTRRGTVRQRRVARRRALSRGAIRGERRVADEHRFGRGPLQPRQRAREGRATASGDRGLRPGARARAEP
jgi:Ca-activated chloride channel family protein